MNIIGIVVEYNPFHNGHLYQINKIKQKYKDSIIVVVMSSCFCQRGEYSLLDKWTKTKIALCHDIDLVVELPYKFSSQSSDIFAFGAINILNILNIDTICFGSEENDLNNLKSLANIQLNNNSFDLLVNKYISQGYNYPTSVNKALEKLGGKSINKANDLLNISYIKQIMKLNNNIDIFMIKRTNDYHDLDDNSDIISASNIRNKMLNNCDIKKFVPITSYNYLKNININSFEKNYFKYLKYSIMSNIDNLDKFNTVDEGIENRIKKYINASDNLDDFIKKIKTKRYTYNKIKRMLSHILVGYSKKDNDINNIDYIRILGFNTKGKKYLNKIKKDIKIPLITNYDKNLLNHEYKITKIYSLITEDNSLIEKEYKNKPIYYL